MPEGKPEQFDDYVNPFSQPLAPDGSVAVPTAEREFTSTGSVLKDIELAFRFLPTITDQQRLDILRQELGDELKVGKDIEGNVILEHRGERTFLNKPGLSGRDIAAFASNAAAFTPAGRAGRAVATGTLARGGAPAIAATRGAIAGGAGTAATSVGLDLAAQAAGSEQSVDLLGAGVAGLTAGTLERISPALSRIFRRAPDEFIIDGQFTQTAREAMADLGVNPAEVSEALGRAFRQQAEVAARGVPQGATAAAARRFDIPLTAGEATQDFGEMAVEENLRMGGTFVGRPLRDTTVRQTNRMREVAGELEQRAARGVPVQPTEADVAGALAGNIRNRAATRRAEIRSAYSGLDEIPESERPSISPETYRGVINRVRGTLRGETISESVTPLTFAMRQKAARLETVLRKRGGRMRAVDFMRLESGRREINQALSAAQKSKNANDVRLLTAMKNEYDSALDDAINDGLLSGDPRFVDELKRARNLRAAYGNDFERGGATARTAARNPAARATGKTMQLFADADVTPEEALDFLMGKSAIGFKKETGRTVRHMVDTFGADSAEVSLLREAVVKRLFRGVLPDDAAVDAGVRSGFNRGKFMSNFDKMRRDAPTVLNELFSPDELGDIIAFRRVVSATQPKPGVANPSGSGFKIMQGLGQLGRALNIASLAGAGAAGASTLADSETGQAVGLAAIILGLGGRTGAWRASVRRAGGVPGTGPRLTPLGDIAGSAGAALVQPALADTPRLPEQ